MARATLRERLQLSPDARAHALQPIEQAPTEQHPQRQHDHQQACEYTRREGNTVQVKQRGQCAAEGAAERPGREVLEFDRETAYFAAMEALPMKVVAAGSGCLLFSLMFRRNSFCESALRIASS
jgi:hypothetical protein